MKSEEFVMLGKNLNIIESFDEQDILILSKVKEENKFIAKNIIAHYGLTHSLSPIFKKFKNDYESLQKALLEFSNKRKDDLLELIKNL
jgi:hypothetical protein